MNEVEVGVLLDKIADDYPYAKLGPTAVVTYFAGLHDLPAAAVWQAYYAAARLRDYPPTVHALREQVYRVLGVESGEDAWAQLVALVKTMPPYDLSSIGPVAQVALVQIGGMGTLRRSEHPTLLRKDYLEAYQNVFNRELVTPRAVVPMVEAWTNGGAAGELARAEASIEPGAGGHRSDGAVPAGSAQRRGA